MQHRARRSSARPEAAVPPGLQFQHDGLRLPHERQLFVGKGQQASIGEVQGSEDVGGRQTVSGDLEQRSLTERGIGRGLELLGRQQAVEIHYGGG